MYIFGLTAILDCDAPCDKNGELHFEVGALTPAVAITKDTNVSDLAAGPRVFLAFHLMNIGWDFLRLEPEKWNKSDDHRKLVDYASRIQVTNDLAERAVQLFSLYHGKVTHDETDRQNLMSSVIRQRRNKSNLSRDALTDFNQNKHRRSTKMRLDG